MQDCHQLYVAMNKKHEEVFDLKWEGIGIYNRFIQLLSIVMKELQWNVSFYVSNLYILMIL
jgi:hypothetical protein